MRTPDAFGSLAVNAVEAEVYTLLNRAQIAFGLKEQIYQTVKEMTSPAAVLASLASMNLSSALYGALCEILTARF